jgi:type IV pilus assembly protein PilQ
MLVAALALGVAAAVPGGPRSAASAVASEPSAPVPASLLELSVDSEEQPGDGAAVVLRLSGAVDYRSEILSGPDRVVLDLVGVVNRLERRQLPVGRGGVVRARAAQHAAEPVPVARVVFDLEAPRPFTVERTPAGLRVAFSPPAPLPVATEAAGAQAPPVEAIVSEMESRFAGLEAVPADPAPPLPAPAVPATVPASRAVEPDLIDRLLRAPVLASPRVQAESASPAVPASFETKTIGTDRVIYSGKEISLSLVDADVKQVFRLFHEISGLNFVLDPSVSGRVTISLDHVPWDQALDIILKNNGLDKVLEGNVIRIASTQKLAQEAAARKQLKEAKDLEVEPITITRTLSYGKAKDVERVIRDSGVLTTRGKVIVDERTNTLIVSDVPKKVEPLDTLISTLDSETPQVMIEARVVESSRDFVRNLGVDWGFAAIADASKGTSTGLAFPHNASVKYGLNLPGEGQASNLAFKFGNVIDSFTLDVALNTLENEGYGRVLSSPRIATQNNERAEIEQGVRIPIVNTTATEINVEFVSASLKMIVTPQITAEGTIILDVEVENNSPDFVQTAGGIPSIKTQRAQTKVLISDGGTTVIGGIFTVNEGQSEVGVPWFRKVPGFGWLFKSQNITRQNRELLIFITPKIMRIA